MLVHAASLCEGFATIIFAWNFSFSKMVRPIVSCYTSLGDGTEITMLTGKGQVRIVVVPFVVGHARFCYHRRTLRTLYLLLYISDLVPFQFVCFQAGLSCTPEEAQVTGVWQGLAVVELVMQFTFDFMTFVTPFEYFGLWDIPVTFCPLVITQSVF